MENQESRHLEKKELLIERRPATNEDKDFAKAMHHAAYRDVVIKQFGDWDETKQNEFFEDEWSSADHEIITCDGEPCGYCAVEETDKNLLVKELVISPDFQGKGIGKKLLAETLARARLQGFTVTLSVLKENRAKDLYRKMGFKFIENNTGQDDATHLQMKFDPNEK